MTQKELKIKLHSIIADKKARQAEFKSCEMADNPQIKELLQRTIAEINAFAAVLDALHGNPIMLNTFVHNRIDIKA